MADDRDSSRRHVEFEDTQPGGTALAGDEVIRLFEELAVPTAKSDMSFAVSMADPDLEWAGSSLATLFAQKRNLARRGLL